VAGSWHLDRGTAAACTGANTPWSIAMSSTSAFDAGLVAMDFPAASAHAPAASARGPASVGARPRQRWREAPVASSQLRV